MQTQSIRTRFAQSTRNALTDSKRTLTKSSLVLGTAMATVMTLALPIGAHAKGGKNPVVLIKTSMGEIKIQLDQKKAPISVKNFLSYVSKKQYDGTIFHRVIPGFMIQGGGMTPDMSEKPTYAPIKNEGSNGLKNKEGTIAMARTSDPNSATAQFFINVADNAFLDYKSDAQPGYAVFGKVTSGMDVVHKIEHVATTSKPPHENVPVEAVTIQSISLSK